MRISDWSSDVCSSDLAVEGDGDDHLLALDEVFVVDAVGGGSDERPARSREFVAHRDQFFAHHAIKFDTVGENRKQFLNDGSQLTAFLADFVAAERGDTVQAEVEDRLPLYFGQALGCAVLHPALYLFDEANVEIGRAHVCTPVTNTPLFC